MISNYPNEAGASHQMKRILIGLSAALWLSTCGEVQPYGFYLVSEGERVKLVGTQESPFQYPQAASDSISELLIHMPQFHPSTYSFHYRPLLAAVQNLTPEFYPTEEPETYRVVFPENLPQGGVIETVTTRGTQTHWSAFVGNHRASVLELCARADQQPEDKLEVVQEYNRHYPGQRLNQQLVQLENEIEDRFIEEALAMATASQRQVALQEYLERYATGKYVPIATRTLEYLDLKYEDHALATAIGHGVGQDKVAALERLLIQQVSGWNRAQTQAALREAQIEMEIRTFEEAGLLSGWQQKKALERYLKLFIGGMNQNAARTMLSTVNRELDAPFYQKAQSYRSNNRQLKEFRKYLDNFPQGKYRANAMAKVRQLKQAIEQQQFKQAMTLAGHPRKNALQAYQHEYPNGTYRDEAQTALAKLEIILEEQAYRAAQAIKSDYRRGKALETYILVYPKGRFYGKARQSLIEVHQRREQTLFEGARKKESMLDRRRALRLYLDIYPNGTYRKQAEEYLQQLNG